MDESHQEMQLLSHATPSAAADHSPSLDLQLSITVKPPPDRLTTIKKARKMESSCAEALRWQAAEQIRLAAMERAYAERVRELTRREMELAQSEFARARAVWERARDEVQRAERIKERAVDSACMEITCQSCRQKFKP